MRGYPIESVNAYPESNNHNLRIAITGTVVVHALLLVLLAWSFTMDAARKLWDEAHKPPPEKEVTLLFPDQIMPPPQLLPPPPPPPPKREVYIRTSQNQASDTAPKNPAFIADRNTTAATVKAPSPDATAPMPTLDGLKIASDELADRDYRDGQLKDDARPKTPPKELAMMQPQPPVPPAPPSLLPPTKNAPPPQPVVPPTNVAKAVPETTPLTKMMEEADKELAKVDKNRLPLEVKKAENPKDQADSPPKTEPKPPTPDAATPKPEMAVATPPEAQPQNPIPKALPVMEDEPVTKTTNNQDPNAFTPFTRTQQQKGTISNRGSVAAVDAEETPKGRYIRQVTGQVEKKWHVYRLLRGDGVTYGSLQIVFYVNKKGKVESLRVINDKESNPVLTAFTLQAIKDAEIPPMPTDVIPSLPMNDQERLKVEYNVLIY